MPNGMPTWEEWNSQLSEEQRQYSLYKILSDLYRRECHIDKHCHEQIEECKKHFEEINDRHMADITILKRRKWFDKLIAVVCGLISGLFGALGIK